MNTDRMLEQLGSEATTENVHAEFDGKSKKQILSAINKMFPSEDRSGNEKLADAIYEFCN